MDKKTGKQKPREQEWQDISNEEYRKYLVVTSAGSAELKISEPKGLKVEKITIGSGDTLREAVEHIILDQKGEQHRIAHGWLKLSFKLKSYEPQEDAEPKA